MRRTALVYHPDYLLHDAGRHHPERPERLAETMDYFRKTSLLEKLTLLKPEPCDVEEILRVHTIELLNIVKNLSASGGGFIDADTYCSPRTYEVARLAAGGCMLAGKAVMEKQVDNAFALIRPPGHHATKNKAGGFCYFNNAAIMIRYLQKFYRVQKVFLFDWDAHAGNGTMDIFYDDPSVLNVSIHQDPGTFYPGTGFVEQCGTGRGAGYTINVPVPQGTGDADYIHILKDFVIPLAERYGPDLIVIAAGQDSHASDSISGLCLTENGYAEMTKLLAGTAEKICSGRLVAELEGGYDLLSFARSNHAIASTLLGIGGDYEIRGEIKESTDLVLTLLRDSLLSDPGAFKAP